MSSKPSINQSLLTKINPDHLEALLDEEKPSLGDSVEGPTIVDVRTEIDNDNEENGMEVEDNGTSYGEHAAGLVTKSILVSNLLPPMQDDRVLYHSTSCRTQK